MAVPHQAQIRDKNYLNWVRAGLALKYTKEGLESFIDDETKEFHSSLLKQLGQQLPQNCGQCTIDNLLPHKSSACPGQRHTCICSKHVNNRRDCPNNICGTICTAIISAHRFKGPAWKNSHISQWVTDHWETGKNYLPNTGGYLNITSAKDTDLSGLVNIGVNLVNITDRHQFTRLNIDGAPDDFCQCRNARNTILHSASQALTDDELKDYLSVMGATLQCTTALNKYPSAQKSLSKLSQLESSAFEITDENITEVRQMVEIAIRTEGSKQIEAVKDEGKKLCRDAIRNIGLEVYIQQKILKTEGEHVKETVTNEGKRQVQMIQQAATIQEDVKYKEEKIKLRHSLIENYLADLQPSTLPEVDRLYVEPSMKLVTDGTGGTDDTDRARQWYQFSGRHGRNLMDSSTKIKEVFFQDQTPFNRIYISGDAGHGKTALCKMLVLAWCQVHSDQQINDHIPADFLTVMKNFDFLFYITLRNVREDRIVSEMIKKQYFVDQDFYNRFIKSECDKSSCLVILDGLDEWCAPRGYDLPDFRHIGRFTVLTTTRPWKLEILRLEPPAIDRQVRLTGIGKEASDRYMKDMVNLLNKKKNVRKESDDFKQHLKIKNLKHFGNIPIILKQLIILWHHDEKDITGRSQVHLYSAMINHLLRWERNKKKALPGGTCHASELPNCVKEKQYCEIHKDLLLSLAHLAFTATLNGHLIFNHVEAKLQNLTEDDINSCLSAGLLCQEIYASPQDDEKKKLSFLHKSFQDFLTAVYLVMNPESRTQLSQICNTMEKIREMASVFVFVCGMDFRVMKPLSESIGKTLEHDKEVYMDTILCSIQNLMIECVRESRDSGQPSPHLESVPIVIDIDEWRDINWQDVKDLISTYKSCIKYIYIKTKYEKEPHEDFLTCVRLVSECRSVQHVYLEVHKRLNQDTGALLEKALCDHWSLSSLELQRDGCKPYLRYLYSDRVTTLVKLHIYNVSISSPTEYQRIMEGVGKATQLETLDLDDVNCRELNGLGFREGYRKPDLDLSHCSQLQKLTLEWCSVNKVTINTTSLTFCKVYNTPVYFVLEPHVGTTIQTLKLRRITDPHSLDDIATILPHLTQLSYLALEDLDFGDRDVCLSPEANYLKEVRLENIMMEKTAMIRFLTSIPTTCQEVSLSFKHCSGEWAPSMDKIWDILPHLTRVTHLELEDLDFGDRDVCLSSETNYLKKVRLKNTRMEKTAMIRFLTSIPTTCHWVILAFNLFWYRRELAPCVDRIGDILPHLTRVTHLELVGLDFGDRDVCLSSESTHLETVELREVTMTDRAMIQFLDSILTINHKVNCSISGKVNEAVKEHINTRFVVTWRRENRDYLHLVFHIQPAVPDHPHT